MCSLFVFSHFGVRPLLGIFEKNTETHVALHGNYSAPVLVTDLLEVSKRRSKSSSMHSQNIFWLGGAGFL